MPSDLLIAGTSGLAKEAAQLARRIDPKRERWSHIRYVTHSADEQHDFTRVRFGPLQASRDHKDRLDGSHTKVIVVLLRQLL